MTSRVRLLSVWIVVVCAMACAAACSDTDRPADAHAALEGGAADAARDVRGAGDASSDGAADAAARDSTADDSTVDNGAVDSSAPDARRDVRTPDRGAVDASTSSGYSLRFTVNQQRQSDYGQQVVLPPTFGDGPFTFEVWIKPDNSYPVGSTAGGSGQRTNWDSSDVQAYSSGTWWYKGNFLLDGHNNASFDRGTFSLQFYGGGRVRWLFGDGLVTGPAAQRGQVWSVGAYPATSTPHLLDGKWHKLACVRRYSGGSGATLELWVDGRRVASETISGRQQMAKTYWNTWARFPAAQPGWFWGAEKQAAIGRLPQYEDYKGLVAEMRFWGVARSSADLAAYRKRVSGGEAGLLGWWPLAEGTGTRSCDRLAPTRCMTLNGMKPGYWVREAPPLTP